MTSTDGLVLLARSLLSFKRPLLSLSIDMSMCLCLQLWCKISRKLIEEFMSNRDPIGKCLQRVDWWRHPWLQHIILSTDADAICSPNCDFWGIGASKIFWAGCHILRPSWIRPLLALSSMVRECNRPRRHHQSSSCTLSECIIIAVIGDMYSCDVAIIIAGWMHAEVNTV